MKYNAEVDSEKRNKSPRNDLLRNRKCLGIIQAAKAHSGTFTCLQRRQASSDVTRCQSQWSADRLGSMSRVGGRSAAAVRSQETMKSVYFRGRSSTGGVLIKKLKFHSCGDVFGFG